MGLWRGNAYSTGGLAFETCLGGGEAGGGGNSEEDGRLHDVLNWLGDSVGFLRKCSFLVQQQERKLVLAGRAPELGGDQPTLYC